MQNLLHQALALAKENQLDAAYGLIEKGLAETPDDFDMHRLAGAISVSRNKGEDALAHLSRLTAASIANAGDFYNIGRAYMLFHRADYAVQAYTQSLRLGMSEGQFWVDYGKALAADGKTVSAKKALENSLKLQPENAEAWATLSGVHLLLADAVSALESAKRAIKFAPEHSPLQSAALMLMQYLPNTTPLDLFNTHRQAAPAFGPDQKIPMTGESRTGRKLRIGFLSANFKSHPVGWFLLPLVQHIDRDRVEICFYSTAVNREHDPQRNRLKDSADEWHEIAELTNSETREYLRAAQLDILIDNGGFRAWNRIACMTARIAPVQMSWLESTGTTGIQNIDAIIADPHHVPRGEDDCYSEEVLRLPHCYNSIAFPDAPPGGLPNTAPFETAGHITFGSISLPGKLNDHLLTIWSRILKQVDNSRILLKYKGLGQPELQQFLRARFARHDIAPERILFEDYSPYDTSLSRYRDVIDIALDPFPYTGGLTTLEAAWMGCPVIAKRGQIFAGRHSSCYLENMNLAAWIAEDEDSYVRLATKLALDPNQLKQLRKEMRPRLQASPMMRHQEWADDFLAAMEDIYDRHSE